MAGTAVCKPRCPDLRNCHYRGLRCTNKFTTNCLQQPAADLRRQHRTESGSWARKSNRIRFLGAETWALKPNRIRLPSAGTELHPASGLSKPNQIRTRHGHNRTEFELGICKPNPELGILAPSGYLDYMLTPRMKSPHAQPHRPVQPIASTGPVPI